MRKRTMTIAALATLVLLAGTAIAQPGGMSGRPMNHAGMDQQRPGGPGSDFFQRILPMMRMLDLSDDQREAIGYIMEDTRDSIESLRSSEDAGSHRDNFLELFSSSTITASQVEALLNVRVETMKDVNRIIAQALVDIHDVLTAEQLATLAEFEPGSMEMRMGDRDNMGHSGTNRGVHPNR
ncbi:MAG: Spy/CpxP family protein refolding chaperone [Candidatus Sabulitectum sp.]|nr:Spy/CpxP family protein refolding chaperone [Candidatus Sabulitectum sp.]